LLIIIISVYYYYYILLLCSLIDIHYVFFILRFKPIPIYLNPLPITFDLYLLAHDSTH